MQILNAVEAISPAIARTKLVLFTPFRKGRSWKLAATAYLSFCGTVFFPFTLVYMAAAPVLLHSVGRWAAIALVVGSLLMTAIYTLIFYLCSRVQFAFFDIVVNRGEFVAPAWRKYGAVARPWTLIKMAGGVVLTGLLAAPMVPLGRAMYAMLATMPETMKSAPQGQMPPQMISIMGAFYGAYFLLVFVIGVYALAVGSASSFMVPSMALEGMTPGAAFRRFWAFVQRETGAFFGFIGMRLVLGIAGYFALVVAFEIVLLVLGLIFGLICAALGLGLHALGVPTGVLIALGILALVCFILFVDVYLLLLVIGAFFTFFEAHSLYFLGGRYPMLGELLERSTPPPVLPAAYTGPYMAPPPVN